jgi:hypothetical protein
MHAPAQSSGSAGVAATGFLLRSQAASHWPGLEIDGFSSDRSAPLRVLRFEQLSPTLLLCLFEGALGQVTFNEPAEGLHFGLDMPAADHIDVSTFFKRLRHLTASSGGAFGDTFEGATVTASYRPGNVLRVADLADAMQRTLGAKPFTSAEFALEMVEGVGRVNFIADIAPPH